MRPRKLPPLNNVQKQVIIGSVLGDGYITYRWRTYWGQAALVIRQYDMSYTVYKNRLLGNLVSGHIGHQITIRKDKNNRREDTYYFQSFTHPEITSFWHAFYSTGTKAVERHILEQIEPLGLAIWFMDDGCIQDTRKQNPYIKLSTNSFTRIENELIQSVLKNKFGIESRIHTTQKYHYLTLTVAGTKKFIKLVNKFIIPSMRYKLGIKLSLG